VTWLRTVLRWQAVLWGVSGAALALAPGWVVERLLGQPELGEDAWLRVAGVMAIALAAQMVLVQRRVDDLWWWSWSFVLLEAGTALVFVLNAILGLPDGVAVWPWWALGLLNVAVGALLLAALARAGTERPPV
jgi:hypothetical protein